MREPMPAAIFSLHQPALIRFFRPPVGVVELLDFGVRAGDVGRAFHHHHATLGFDFAEQVVIDAVEFVELVCLAASRLMNDLIRLRNQIAAIGRQLPQMDFIAVAKIGADQISLAIVVPERTTIVPARRAQHRVQRFPRTGDFPCRRHEVTLVGRAEINPEFLIVIPDGPGPDAFAVAVHPVPVQFGADLREVGDGVVLDRPVHQILGVQDYHARRKLKCG